MKKFLIRATLIFGGLIILALLIVIIEWHYTRSQGRKQLALVKAKLDADEPGWRMEDVIAKRKATFPEPEKNLAEFVRRVVKDVPQDFSKWQSTTKIASDSNSLGHRLHPEDLIQLKEQYRKIESIMAPLSTIRQYPTGGFNVDWSKPNPWDVNLEGTQKMREAASLFRWQAYLQSAEGQHDAAIETVRNQLHLRMAINTEPTLISQLVRIALTAISRGQAERVLALGEPKKGLAELQADFTKAYHERFMEAGLEGERAIMNQLFDNMANGKVDAVQALTGTGFGGGPGGVSGVFQRIGVTWAMRNLESNHAILLERLTAARDALRLKGKARDQAISQVGFKGPRSVNTLFVSLYMPAIEKVIAAETRNEGQLATIIIAIACERHRQQTGRWPESIADIPKSILNEQFTDPHIDEPVRMIRTPTGLKIYCCGPDATDNQGNLKDAGVNIGTDIGVELFDPAHRNRPPLPIENREKDDSPFPDINPAKKNPYVPPPIVKSSPEGEKQ